MTNRPFLQIHTITSYPASLLNRDNVGLAKRIPFGGFSRLRISSQCLKRHWRTADGPASLSNIDFGGDGDHMSVRSRSTFNRLVLQRLVQDGTGEVVAVAVTEAVMRRVLGQSAKSKQEKDSEKDAEKAAEKASCMTKQLTVLGRPEINFLYQEAAAIAADVNPEAEDILKEVEVAAKAHLRNDRLSNLKGLRLAAGLDAALFGRMTTSDLLARTDAPVHVAHAFTVHEEMSESDFFSAVDELDRAEFSPTRSTALVGNTELTTGVYYGYVAVDLPLLVSNLKGIPTSAWAENWDTLPQAVVGCLVRLIATVSPGAKLGSTAPHSFAQLVVAERGDAQPRSLANAFLVPVRAGEAGILHSTYAALDHHLEAYERMYGVGTERCYAGVGPLEVFGSAFGTHVSSLEEVATWAADLHSATHRGTTRDV